MNIAPKAENAGRTHNVFGAPPGSGVRVRNDVSAAAQRALEEDEDDFDVLVNSDKRRPTGVDEDARSARSDAYSDGPASRPASVYNDAPPAQHQSSSSYGQPAYGQQQQSPYDQPQQYSDFRSIEEEKQFYLQKIHAFNSRGIPSHRRVSIETPIDELKYEYHRLKRQQDLGHSVKFQRRILMATVTGLEFLNKRFNPLGLKLDGWSESMMDGVEEYDAVFEQLHDKYSGTAEVAPEYQLMMMVLGSGFMFHLSNTLFRSVLPNVSDVAKQNPELMQNIADAMSKAMAEKGDGGDGGGGPAPGPTAASTGAPPPGNNMSQMGLGLAMQAMGGPAQFDVPLQGPAVDPTIMELPQNSSPNGLADDQSDRFSEASSAVSGMSELRQVRGQGRGRRRSKKDDSERSVELDL